MKKYYTNCFFLLSVIGIIILSNCSQSAGTNDNTTTTTKTDPMKDKGIGQFKEMQLTHPLDESMVDNGELIYKAKCIACHKLTEEKLVGPGWKGVTNRRSPEWIMNFITNTDLMLDSNLVAQQLMAVCVARMPNQNLSNEDARNVLEFIRKNDGKN